MAHPCRDGEEEVVVVKPHPISKSHQSHTSEVVRGFFNAPYACMIWVLKWIDEMDWMDAEWQEKILHVQPQADPEDDEDALGGTEEQEEEVPQVSYHCFPCPVRHVM